MCFSNMRLQLRETDLANLKNKKNDCPLPHQYSKATKDGKGKSKPSDKKYEGSVDNGSKMEKMLQSVV